MVPPSARPGSHLAWPRLAAYAAVACGFALALHQLGQDSLWSDEIVTARLARQPLADVWAAIRPDPVHLPSYYLLQWAFSFAGTSEWGLRLPSAFVATATVAAVYWLGREVLDDRAGVAAALLLATHPAHLWAAQEARYYALVGLAAALSAAGLLSTLRLRGLRPAVAFAMGTVAGLYTHFFCLAMAAAEAGYSAIVLALGLRRDGRREANWLLASGAAIALLSVPLVPYLLRLLRVEQGGSTPMVTATTLLELWYEYGSRSDTLKVVFLALAVGGLAAALRSRPRAALLAVLWFVPLPALMLRQGAHFSLPKYFYYLFPMYVALVGAGIAVLLRLTQRALRVPTAPLLLLVGLLNVPTLSAYYASEKFDWRAATDYLAAVAGPDDLVVTLPPTEPEMAWYYWPRATGTLLVPFGAGRPSIEPLVSTSATAAETYWIVLLPSGSQPESAAVESAFEVRTFYGVAVLRSRVPALEAAAAILPAFAASCGSDAVLAGPAWDTAGAVLEQLQRPEAARAAYANALSLYREERVRRRLLGDVARLDGDWPLAQAEYEAATTSAPDLPEVYLSLAQARQANGDGAGAVAAYVAYWRLTGSLPAGLCVAHDLLGELGTATVSAPEAAIDTPYCQPGAPATCYVSPTRFTLPDTGEARDVLFQHPTSVVTFTLPPGSDQAYLVAAPLLDPQSWGWGGDGVTFRVLLAGGGEPQVLGERLVTAADRSWKDWVLPLPVAAGAVAELQLETDAGPAGNAAADWAGWADPLVVTLCGGE
ncbi:MAG: glycosyltransferase family 39 protein [Anaerolineae bacterium]